MKVRLNIFRQVFMLLVLSLYCSCVMNDPEDCCYNVRLEYRYQRYGVLGENELGFYVRTLREYVFDGRDVLVAINDYQVPHGNGDFFSEQTLLPGRYTVITFGNKGDYELVEQESVALDAEIGVTTREKLLLTLHNPQGVPENAPYTPETPQLQGRSDRLYYGYRNFEVGKFGVSRLAVDMTHAHCILGITVRWKDNSGHPRPGEQYTYVLRQVPSEYHFMPEFLVNNGYEPGTYDADSELYPIRDRRRINYIPNISRGDIVSHTVSATASGNSLYGRFISFRYRGDSHVLLSIWSSSGCVMKEIDLYRFFRENGIDLDHSLWQEYELQIEIDGDEVSVGLVQVLDWEDGGEL